ncbi:MAG: phosphoribosylanthranilate isomerase, partial [Pseudomonadota bacterium]|nr:phosphoribosylanthranilate isomerase [Pseudomonadota bacterium]
QETTDLNVLVREFSQASGLLLDAYIPGVPGGTGEQFNWSWILDTLNFPVILAGGLTAENVKQAINIASPWAVDVSGGVELSKGVKSPEKIKQFMQQVMSTVE